MLAVPRVRPEPLDGKRDGDQGDPDDGQLRPEGCAVDGIRVGERELLRGREREDRGRPGAGQREYRDAGRADTVVAVPLRTSPIRRRASPVPKAAKNTVRTAPNAATAAQSPST